MTEIKGLGGRLHLSKTDFEKTVLEWVNNYAYNTSEICRIVNDISPHDFKGCNHSVEEKDFFAAKGMCKCRERGCRMNNRNVHSRMKRMQKAGKIRSVKMLWLDGREPGAVNHHPTDIFRIWYLKDEFLSTRLIQDVKVMVGAPAYE
jgi:hypothetical protein